jgi:hypothetical protein
MTIDEETTDDAIAKFTGVVTRCPPGEGTAPDAKEYGQTQFRCTCGHRGTMAYQALLFAGVRYWGQSGHRPR